MTTFAKYNNLEEKLEVTSDGGKFSLTYDGEPIRLQTPILYIPFGCRQFSGKFNKVTCTLDLSLRGYDEEGNKVKKFRDWYNALEESMFSKFNLDQNQFNSCIKHDNPDFPPLLRIKTPIVDGVIDSTIWMEHKEQSETIYGKINERFKGKTSIAIITPTPYKMPHGMWGISWKLEQMRVFETKRLRGCLFLD